MEEILTRLRNSNRRTEHELKSYQREYCYKTTVDKIPFSTNLRHEKIHSLCRITAIYFLKMGDFIVYVGKTTDLIGRIPAHIRDKVFDSYSYYPLSEDIPDRVLSELETIFISELRPLYNKEWLIHNISNRGDIQTAEKILSEYMIL